jgi:hypothetical protein
MKSKWKDDACYLGKWKVGCFLWDGLVTDENKYRAVCLLPGVKQLLGHFKTPKEAIDRVNTEVEMWLRKAGE